GAVREQVQSIARGGDDKGMELIASSFSLRLLIGTKISENQERIIKAGQKAAEQQNAQASQQQDQPLRITLTNVRVRIVLPYPFLILAQNHTSFDDEDEQGNYNGQEQDQQRRRTADDDEEEDANGMRRGRGINLGDEEDEDDDGSNKRKKQNINQKQQIPISPQESSSSSQQNNSPPTQSPDQPQTTFNSLPRIPNDQQNPPSPIISFNIGKMGIKRGMQPYLCNFMVIVPQNTQFTSIDGFATIFYDDPLNG
ncbi:MAG: hypothetical protein EZS28_050422, partial [Streblomastix strix]